MAHPHVELLWWEGCPSWKAALEDLRSVMAEVGLDPSQVVVREIVDLAHAKAEGFAGSPTIRVDGRDVQPPDAGDMPSLSCRVFHLRDGRVSPTPDREDIRDALESVASRA
jgi:hypothetical protein